MLKFVTAVIFLFSLSIEVQAATPSTSKREFCTDRSDPQFVKALTGDMWNLVPLYNQGGIINGGVCWWHSRFQRNALYLTIFNPKSPKPTDEEAIKIIQDIRLAKSVVTIPGFNNFFEFSYKYYPEIQRELEAWQKYDALRFAWVKGLKGKTSVKAQKLKDLMDQTYEEVEIRGDIAYQKLQMKGVTAHAWLVINMQRTQTGYELEVLDSNSPLKTKIYNYEEGMSSLEYHDGSEFVPYVENTKEMDHIKNIIETECSQELA